ncbi:hypothetical protein Tco_0389997 [Tanacetum coccineum]
MVMRGSILVNKVDATPAEFFSGIEDDSDNDASSEAERMRKGKMVEIIGLVFLTVSARRNTQSKITVDENNRGRNKTGFIDNTCRRSNIDEVLGREWDRVNVVVLGWILNSISKELFLGQFFQKELLSEKSHRAVVIGSRVGSSQRARYSVLNSSVNNRGSTQRFQTYGNKSRPNNVSRPSNNGNRRSVVGPNLISKLISLIKENSLNDNGKGVHANMAELKFLTNPNGIEAFITKVGNLDLTDFLTLYDVLVVAEYCVTLEFVHKVARDSKFIDDLEHPQGSNGFASENEMAATFVNDYALSEGDVADILDT